MNKNRIVLIAVLVVVVLAVVGYTVFGRNKTGQQLLQNTTGGPSVATVNGVAISKSVYEAQLSSAIASYKAQGVDVTSADKLAEVKTQVLDNLIDKELVNQAITNAGIKANPTDVEKQVQDIIKQAGGEDKYKAELAKANITDTQYRESLAWDLAFRAFLEANVDLKGIAVTEKEISKFYEMLDAPQPCTAHTADIPRSSFKSAYHMVQSP